MQTLPPRNTIPRGPPPDSGRCRARPHRGAAGPRLRCNFGVVADGERRHFSAAPAYLGFSLGNKQRTRRVFGATI